MDPCALLTREEAEVIMGPLDWNPIPLAATSCEYDEMITHDSQGKGLWAQVWPPDSWWGTEIKRGDAIAPVPLQDIGLGDETPLPYSGADFTAILPQCASKLPCAVTVEQTDWQMLFVVLHDRTGVEVNVFPKDVESAKEIARKVIGRLPQE
jgi:hypothetical protein